MFYGRKAATLQTSILVKGLGIKLPSMAEMKFPGQSPMLIR
ncbi:hypothetical protein ALO_03226 [Acetonema longum DSM 6540]|uniref:Uncharacterized protein n=1 Tax=Acetonema longum DSM 6540 TaxID=1009370 RepID=F7NF25_9FIRM|nr:hypothetical protein ALO_03226 [Acetonema longum DSM 6540]